MTLPSATTPALDANALAYALARNACGEKLPAKDVLLALGIDPQTTPTLKATLTSDSFKIKYEAFVRELKDSGESFKLKARVQAEELLAVQWEIIQNSATPASVRMKGIENTVEWADLKPKKAVETAPQQAITINIDLGGEKPEVIDITPLEPAPTKALS